MPSCVIVIVPTIVIVIVPTSHQTHSFSFEFSSPLFQTNLCLTFSATAMASAFEMLVPSFASLASNSFEAFVAASFVPSPSSFDVTSSFPPSFAAPPFLSAVVSAAAEGDFGFVAGAGADMFGLLVLVRGLVLLARADTDEGAA